MPPRVPRVTMLALPALLKSAMPLAGMPVLGLV
ncbi:UNVERIFIED_CONTAM: hypothetical protein GTU68_009567 [Idotea baltica]|nr:hypothetical protein [Idotea baltica]